MGSVIGSFLNVVIYRMPLGLNISKPKSRCPVCQTPIQTRDNLPILGWLLLRGKCRTCQAPISVRYPIVEALTGLFFLFLYILLVHSGGQFLPYRTPNRFWGSYQILEGRTWDLIALDVYYSYLFIVLLASAYIQFDGQLIPRRLLIWCFAIGITAGVLIPELHPVPALISTRAEVSNTEALLNELYYYGTLHVGITVETLKTLVWGLLYGAITGVLFCWPGFFRQQSASLFPQRTSWLLILAGVYLGWQQTVTLGFLAACGLFCLNLSSGGNRQFLLRLPASAFIVAILTLQLLFGKYLTILPYHMSYLSYLLVTGFQIIAIPVLTGVSQSIYLKRIMQTKTQDQISIDESRSITF
ncbi:prepilin peptidase [Gimesia sp.]|uniref:A24 family peptidase n=1 Tax=Gimesia sp. TaxID=2024833 RepID=UPI003A8F1530